MLRPKALCLLLLCGALFPGSYPEERFVFALLKYAGNWNNRMHSVKELAIHLMNTTSVSLPLSPRAVSIADPDLFHYPFLMMTGDRGFPPFPEPERRRLRLFLEHGGFLFIDNSAGMRDNEFDRCVRRELAALFPDRPLSALKPDHTIYRTFYLVRRTYFGGRVSVAPFLEGVSLGEVTPVIYSLNDAAGAWEKDGRTGNWSYDVIPGGELQRREAFKLGVNLVMYALTVNYKKDVVHVQTLLKRGRFRSLPWTE